MGCHPIGKFKSVPQSVFLTDSVGRKTRKNMTVWELMLGVFNLEARLGKVATKIHVKATLGIKCVATR